MRLFVQIAFWLYMLAILARLVFLSTKSYPRVVTFTRGEDAFYIVISIGLAFWCAYLLWLRVT
jgi:hypothetical protein